MHQPRDAAHVPSQHPGTGLGSSQNADRIRVIFTIEHVYTHAAGAFHVEGHNQGLLKHTVGLTKDCSHSIKAEADAGAHELAH